MDLDAYSGSSIANKIEADKVVLCDAMDCDGDEGPTEVLISSKKMDVDVSASDIGNSTSITGSLDSVDPLKSSVTGSVNSNIVNSSNSDLSYHDNEEDANDTDDYVDEDDASYDDNDAYYYEDEYSMMQSQFDNVDLPPGVEASLPWLKDNNITSATSTSTCPIGSNIKTSGIATSESVKKAFVSNNPEDNGAIKLTEVLTGTSSVSAESSSNGQVQGNDTSQKVQDFKQFDIVNDFSDHHFSGMGITEAKPPKNWAKKIQEEWKILEKDLPDTIFVRVYEARMDLLRAVIIGPAGTPYHDGLFVFDCLFPPKYPDVPPMVYYYSGGLRLNPNLYECGKVCLSLLGTWSGKETEMWRPKESTMLQVLVSVQALILNTKPFFNEPGHESQYVGAEGERASERYNQDTFIFSLKTMMYTIRRPPKYFEEFVANHFRNRALDILVACKAYREGATVGTIVVRDGIPFVNEVGKSYSGDEFKACTIGVVKKSISREFLSSLGKMINILITNFTKNGSTDCEQFRVAV
ncbi:probable ubiquitin-conjugating enzyme E2 25 isoform X2 [Tripterygium wilfordii]|uniref:probable ubiquitin-conjugating enzyme E2 25 isoform X2 n=1 Tax=Tripterygium wilfordii TaxID=458696 RepID=UPI0018F85AC8|nr:probable ubiquitin-conjugating enzyme E2 25 isoform X2 [Tripterygium wilfordii]XP_038713918.1 probable ubiquitin-conjugating enzyme E2 25 isoform X2 [Tripterygium wilfordii]